MKNKIQEKEKIKTESTVNDLDKLGLGDDVKGQGFLMVHTWCMHI